MTSQNNIDPAHADESADNKKRAEEQARALALQENTLSAQNSGLLDGITGFFQFIGKLFEALFGALNDSASEYSEINQEQAGPQNGRTASKMKLLTPDMLSKLSALQGEYRATTLNNISPFEDDAVITSHLGIREVSVGSKNHKGIDMIPAGNGSRQLRNTMPGVVVRSETQYNKKGEIAGFGHWVEVACIDGTRRRYAHLAAPGVAVGTLLHQGDYIGTMGSSGIGGAHLHYEWRDASGNVLEPEINGITYRRMNSAHDVASYKGARVKPGEVFDRHDYAKQPAAPNKLATGLTADNANVSNGITGIKRTQNGANRGG